MFKSGRTLGLFGDQLLLWSLRGLLSVGLFLFSLLIYKLIKHSLPTWKHFGLNFITGTDWNPVLDQYAALPVIYGTVLTSLLSLLLAMPLAIAIGLEIGRRHKTRLLTLMNFLIETFTTLPSVVIGMWGIFYLVPIMRSHIQPFLIEHLGFLPLFSGAPFGIGYLSATVILAIMILPTLSALYRDVFSSIPQVQVDSALALGMTRWEAIKIAVLHDSRNYIIGTTLIGLGRALGETMAVTMVIGNRNAISLSLLAPGQTMASLIANEYSEASAGLHLSSLTAVGLLLLLVSLLINMIASSFRKRTNP